MNLYIKCAINLLNNRFCVGEVIPNDRIWFRVWGNFAFVAEEEGMDRVFALLAGAITTFLSVLWVNDNNNQLVVITAKVSAMVVVISLSCIFFC